MKSVLLDTHVWVWSLDRSDVISGTAVAAIEQAGEIFVSPVSVYEIAFKVQRGKWPEMAPHVDDLEDNLARQNGKFAALNVCICRVAATLDWSHGDPFDRLIAATALTLDADLVTKDRAFRQVPGLKTIW